MGLLDRVPLPRLPQVGDEDLRAAVDGRTVVITGASSGIGRVSAVRLGRAGARVVLVARRRGALDEVAEQIPEAVVAPCDLTDADATEELCDRLVDLGIDVLINNAGHSIRRSVARAADPAADAERLMALNYLAPVRLIGALLADLAAVRGQVVCVSSLAAQSSEPGFAAYTASKAALDAFTRSVARERAAAGVAFTSVHMPLVRTPMSAPSPDLTSEVGSLSAREAAELVASAVIHRPRRIGTPAGELAALAWAADPAITAALDRRLRELVAGRGGTEERRSDEAGSQPSLLARLTSLAFTTHVRR